jgi:cytochrome c-type biogenesis protein CcsB
VDPKKEGTSMKTILRSAVFALLMLLQLSARPALAASSPSIDVSDFESLAIQDGGRLKPFDTFARESVQLVTGREVHNGKPATEIVLSWLFMPNEWTNKQFVQIKHLQLKKDLGIPETQSYVSPIDLAHNPKLTQLFGELAQMQKDKKKLDPYYQAVARINNQLSLYQEIISGNGLRFVPQKISPDWIALSELKGPVQQAFGKIAGTYFTALGKGDVKSFKDAVVNFKNLAKAEAPAEYPSDSSLQLEITYNKLHPFRWSYILYLIAAILFLFSLKFTASRPLRLASVGVMAAGIVMHGTGFLLRCLIAGRPPVSNMYESIIWVSLGCVVFGFVFEMIYKRSYIGLAATAVSTIALIIGDSVPAVLDPSIHPLEPVLRSNYWLTIHVLTITLSYAAFALAMGIGNIGLSYYVRGIEEKSREKLTSLALFQYRAVQVGVLLLTAGTILGGVWADYSWGRFWGWDPKETWALIADLGYLAVLHGRFSGWLRTFGSLASSVVCFTGVVMAWYGVNFVLGVGLHSYGFGGGGVHYVTAIVVLQLLYVGFAAIQHKKFMDKTRALSTT